MEIDFQLTRAEYEGGLRIQLAELSNWAPTIVASGIPIIFGILFLLLLRELALGSVLIGIGILVVLRRLTLPRYMAGKYFGRSGVDSPFHLRITEEGIEARTALSDSKRQWAGYSRVVEDDRTFTLFHSGGLFFIIPKRAFTSEQLDEFRELLRRKLPTK